MAQTRPNQFSFDQEAASEAQPMHIQFDVDSNQVTVSEEASQSIRINNNETVDTNAGSVSTSSSSSNASLRNSAMLFSPTNQVNLKHKLETDTAVANKIRRLDHKYYVVSRNKSELKNKLDKFAAGARIDYLIIDHIVDHEMPVVINLLKQNKIEMRKLMITGYYTAEDINEIGKALASNHTLADLIIYNENDVSVESWDFFIDTFRKSNNTSLLGFYSWQHTETVNAKMNDLLSDDAIAARKYVSNLQLR